MDIQCGVVIGSYAHTKIVKKETKKTELWSYTPRNKDIDIICLKEMEDNIKTNIKSKEKYIIVDFMGIDGSDMMLFEWCNKNKDLCETIEFAEIKLLIPPLIILYVIYGSHVHRILPVTKLQTSNVVVWHEKMEKYTSLRNKVLAIYPNIDKIIYKEEYERNYIEQFAHDLFHKRFTETNDRVGDTFSLFNSTKEAFFDDGITRYIDHDVLHRRIARNERKTEELIFKRFQKKDDVSIDEELFMHASKKDRGQMFREEVIVLFLERVLIPELKNNLKYKIPFRGFKRGYLEEKLKEVVAHLVTNLSGNGHYFLRRYALNHYDILMLPYDFGKIEYEAMDIAGYKVKYSQPDQNLSLQERIDRILRTDYANLDLPKKTTDTINFYCDNKLIKSIVSYVNYGYNGGCICRNGSQLLDERKPCNFCKDKTDLLIVCNDYKHNKGAYNHIDNIGIAESGSDYIIFSLEVLEKDRDKLTMNVIYEKIERKSGSYYYDDGDKYELDSDVDEDEVSYDYNTIISYYQSHGCTEQAAMERETAKTYLNNFGDVPNELKGIIETIARKYLEKDEYDGYNPSMHFTCENAYYPYN